MLRVLFPWKEPANILKSLARCRPTTERQGIIMEIRKTNAHKRAEYTYTDAFGRRIVIREGDCTIDDHRKVTAEDIRELHRLDDNWVECNRRNGKPKRTKEEKEAIEAWNEEHPDREIPDGWTMSLDQFHDDPDSDKDYSPIEHEIFNRTHQANYFVETLHEIMDEMPEKIRYCLVQIKLLGRSRYELARELDVDLSTISHRLRKAIQFIKDNEDRFNFR